MAHAARAWQTDAVLFYLMDWPTLLRDFDSRGSSVLCLVDRDSAQRCGTSAGGWSDSSRCYAPAHSQASRTRSPRPVVVRMLFSVAIWAQSLRGRHSTVGSVCSSNLEVRALARVQQAVFEHLWETFLGLQIRTRSTRSDTDTDTELPAEQFVARMMYAFRRATFERVSTSLPERVTTFVLYRDTQIANRAQRHTPRRSRRWEAVDGDSHIVFLM